MFKPGDKVKCIYNRPPLQLNEVYTVAEYVDKGMIELQGLSNVRFWDNHFELYEEELTMDNLKEGDKLICVDTRSWDFLRHGCIYNFKEYFHMDKEGIYIEGCSVGFNINMFKRYTEPVPEVEPVRVKPKVIYRIPRLVEVK